MTRFHAFSVLAVLALTCVGLALCAPLSHAQGVAPHAPSLVEARVAPSFLARLRAHQSVTVERQCGRTLSGYWSDVQAYRADGSAMGRQHWSGDTDRVWWRYPGTRTRVMFDGVTFRNFTRHAVLVAGWCE